MDLFSVSSCIATSRLVHNGRYVQKLLQLFSWTEILWFGRTNVVTKVYLILTGLTLFWLQYSTSVFANPPLWTSLWRFVKRSIWKILKFYLQKRHLSNCHQNTFISYWTKLACISWHNILCGILTWNPLFPGIYLNFDKPTSSIILHEIKLWPNTARPRAW